MSLNLVQVVFKQKKLIHTCEGMSGNVYAFIIDKINKYCYTMDVANLKKEKNDESS